MAYSPISYVEQKRIAKRRFVQVIALNNNHIGMDSEFECNSLSEGMEES